MTAATPDAPLCAAADPAPRASVFAMPAGACDCHAHICGPATRFPYVPERIYTPPDATSAHYMHLLRTLGASRAVLVQPSVYGEDNRALLDALAAARTGVRGVAVVSAHASPAEIASLHAAGVRGVRLNLVDRREGQNVVPVEVLKALGTRIADYGWHIELLVNVDEAPSLAAAIMDSPVPVVLGHLGYPKAGAAGWERTPAFEGLLRLMAGGRCWVKLTGPYRISAALDLPYADVDAAAARLVAEAPERLIWGTDWPHVMMKKPMRNDGSLTDLLARWAPDADVRRRILVDNPAALYGFVDDERFPA